jgi:hypothetical protein
VAPFDDLRGRNHSLIFNGIGLNSLQLSVHPPNEGGAFLPAEGLGFHQIQVVCRRVSAPPGSVGRPRGGYVGGNHRGGVWAGWAALAGGPGEQDEFIAIRAG